MSENPLSSDVHQSDAAYEVLRPIMVRFGAKGSPKDFYWAINTAYHTVESQQYDQLHEEMFTGSGPVWRRLLRALPDQPKLLNVLDIGSGTGLVAEFLTLLCPERIEKFTSLDPCEAMLQKQKTKQHSWPFKVEYIHGVIQNLQPERQFDLITVNSVLHHVVELEDFCKHLTMLLRPGGILVTAQDSSTSMNADPILAERHREAMSRRQVRPSLVQTVKRIASGVKGRVFGRRNSGGLAEQTCRPLLETGLITRVMDPMSIWAVTDFHVAGQPGGFGHGIDLQDLKRWLEPLKLQDLFTYRFWKLPFTDLNDEELAKEKQWFEASDMHGSVFATAWRFPCD